LRGIDKNSLEVLKVLTFDSNSDGPRSRNSFGSIWRPAPHALSETIVFRDWNRGLHQILERPSVEDSSGSFENDPTPANLGRSGGNVNAKHFTQNISAVVLRQFWSSDVIPSRVSTVTR